MIEFIEEHYKVIAGIVVPVVVAILGVLKIKTLIKKKNSNPSRAITLQ
jgi:hypothetical protein